MRDSKIGREAAVEEVARRFRQWMDVFRDARTADRSLRVDFNVAGIYLIGAADGIEAHHELEDHHGVNG